MKGKKQKAGTGFKNNSDEVTVMENGQVGRMSMGDGGKIYFRVPDYAFLDKHEKTNAHDEKPSTVEMKPEAFGPEAFGLKPDENGNYDFSKIGNVHFYVHQQPEVKRGQTNVRVDTGINALSRCKSVTLYDANNWEVGELSWDEFKKKMNTVENQKFIDHKKHVDFEIYWPLYRGPIEVNENEYLCFELPNKNFYKADRVLIPYNGYKLKESDNPEMYAFSTRDNPVLKATGLFPNVVNTDTNVPELRTKPISMDEFKNDVDKLKLFELGAVSFTVPKNAVIPDTKFTMVRFPVGSEYAGSMCFIPNGGNVSVRPGPVDGVENSDGKYVITCKSDDMIRTEAAKGHGGYGTISGAMLRKELSGAKPEEFFASKKEAKIYKKEFASL